MELPSSPPSPVEQQLHAFLREADEHPERFLQRHDTLIDTSRSLLVLFFQHGLADGFECPIAQLYTLGMDEEQIWGQVQLLNLPLMQQVESGLADLSQRLNEDIDSRDNLEEEVEEDKIEEVEEDFEEIEEEDLEEEEDVEEVEEEDFEEVEEEDLEEELTENNIEEDNLNDEMKLDEWEEMAAEDRSDQGSGDEKELRSAIDDDFFKLQEMEKVADEAWDREEEEEEDDAIDYAADPDAQQDSDDEEESMGLMYNDFFKPPKSQHRRRQAQSDRRFEEQNRKELKEVDTAPPSDTESILDIHESTEPLDLFAEATEDGLPVGAQPITTHQKRSMKLKQSIAALEQENVAQKEWMLMGEVAAKNRPENSLLEQHLDFDYASKPVPIMTEEVTQSLEELIKKKIIEKQFDNVERKLTPAELAQKVVRKTRVELSHEKPTQSLAELYEAEYSKQKENALADPSLVVVEDTRTESQKREHAEIDGLFRALCYKLDALSNYHFTPKPPRAEMEITTPTQAPAISMEDITPTHVSDAQTLAPQEVFDRIKSMLDLKTQEELRPEEKHKLRRKAKQRVRKEKQRRAKDRKIIEGLNPGLGNKHSKEKLMKELAANKQVTLIGKNGDLSRQVTTKVTASSKALKL